MEQLQINTNQNVQVHFALAGIGNRVVAYLIDILVKVGLITVVGLFSILTPISPVVWFIVAGIPFFFYHLISEITMNGQSVGKRVRNIRVVKKDGTQATLSAYFLRFLLRPIDNFYFIGIGVMFFTKLNQRLGDLAAGTVVVKTNEDVNLEEELMVKLPDNYSPAFAAAVNLKEEEVELIKKILNRRAGDRTHASVALLANKLKEILGVQTPLSNYQFLQTLHYDYHYFLQQEIKKE